MPFSTNAPKWLKDYYGKDFGLLNPMVEVDGKAHAIVKLLTRASRGFASLGYVLVKKTGTHSASNEIALHEGLASKEDMAKMRKTLASKED